MRQTANPPQPGGRIGTKSLAALYLLAALCFVVGSYTRGSIQMLTNPRTAPIPAATPRGKGNIPTPITLPKTTKQLPKIALMFLTRGDMPLESIWRWFLGIDNSDNGDDAWQSYFSIYVHPSPGYIGSNTSIFTPFALPDKDRIKIEWGQHSMVDAERALLRAALSNKQNQYFVFVADDTIPLYRPAALYTQLMTDKRSRINVCADHNDPADVERLQQHRWQKEMAAANLTIDLWRKASQWSSLIRKHAQLAAYDKELNAIFSKECWSEGLTNPAVVRRFCVSDEHYIPSLLAVKGLTQECACDGVMTHVYWEGNYYHPKTYGASDATEEGLRQTLRGQACRQPAADFETTSVKVLETIVQAWQPEQQSKSQKQQKDISELILQETVPMPPSCPMFARKIDPNAAELYEHTIAMNTLRRRRKTLETGALL